MATTVRYTSVQGEIIAEKRGGVRKFYTPDPLGSTVALLDNAQTQTDTFTYWPYGEVKSRTGTTPTPLQYVGTAGYYQDSSSKTYVRARHLDVTKGRWITRDPIGLYGGDANLYRYVRNRPSLYADPSGQFAWIPVICAGACGGCLVCLAAAAFQCTDCGTDLACWRNCISGIIANLPPWAKWTCGIACGGCLICLLRPPKPPGEPPVSPPPTEPPPVRPGPPGPPRIGPRPCPPVRPSPPPGDGAGPLPPGPWRPIPPVGPHFAVCAAYCAAVCADHPDPSYCYIWCMRACLPMGGFA